MDHLDGVLILDRTTKEQRKEALRALREGGGKWPLPDRQELEASAA
jgi:peptide deformylase